MIPRLGRSPGEGNSYPLQFSGLENSMDCVVHGVTKSWTRLSNSHFHTLVAGGKTLLKKKKRGGGGFPGDSEVKNLPAKETRVRSLGGENPLEKEMATTPVFLPEKFQGRKSLVSYSPWGCKRVGHDLMTKK